MMTPDDIKTVIFHVIFLFILRIYVSIKWVCMEVAQRKRQVKKVTFFCSQLSFFLASKSTCYTYVDGERTRSKVKTNMKIALE